MSSIRNAPSLAPERAHGTRGLRPSAAAFAAAARGAALVLGLAAALLGGAAGCISVPDEVEEEFAPAGDGAMNHFGRIVPAADGAP